MIDCPKTHDELLEFLRRPKNDEGLDHDFKIGLPYPGDKDNIAHLNKTFCAFANTRGGVLFFGIGNDKTSIGVEQNLEFRKHLAEKLSREIKPEIIRWDLFDPIPHPNPTRLIYIAYIEECVSLNKPHLFEGVAYFRVGSSCMPILDGLNLRRRLEVDRFSPSHIDVLESKLQALSTYDLAPDELDVLYLNKLQVFLDQRTRSEPIAKLRAALQEVRRLFSKLVRKGASFSTGLGEGFDEEDESIKSELEAKIAAFVKQFRQTFIGGVETV